MGTIGGNYGERIGGRVPDAYAKAVMIGRFNMEQALTMTSATVTSRVYRTEVSSLALLKLSSGFSGATITYYCAHTPGEPAGNFGEVKDKDAATIEVDVGNIAPASFVCIDVPPEAMKAGALLFKTESVTLALATATLLSKG